LEALHYETLLWSNPSQGASGAGKTTLLNLLADRVSTGIIHGERTVDLRHQDVAFARKIGYAQQQDLHLNTTTVRETLQFSALLRQPPKYSREEKLAYVSYIAGLLELDKDGLLDAVVGVPGEGLNVAQRKRVTIGVELAARPELLLFLDEPTSGLDSDSSMSFCRLLRVLADHGQAILCVVHQPSAQLLTYFDRLLLLSEGKSLYFGDFGANFSSLISYFERQGARKFEAGENPAEWMLEVSKASTEMDDGKEVQDWAALWKASPERTAIKVECEKMKLDLSNPARKDQGKMEGISSEFATPLWYQISTVTKRAFLHDWYSPTYLWSKSFTTFGLVCAVLTSTSKFLDHTLTQLQAFFNGITFWNSGSTPQDLQNLVFSLFILTTMFGTHVQLIMKRFHDSRVQYESRERQSRTYSWVAFLISNIAVELCSQTVISVIAFVAWYYPIGLWHNAEAQGELSSRGGLTFLLIWSLMVLFQTLSQMLMTIMPDVPTGINIGNLLFMLSLIFSG
jgi:ATP-binding cassette subfamily G (WHITE) protein 2 (PDR)